MFDGLFETPEFSLTLCTDIKTYQKVILQLRTRGSNNQPLLGERSVIKIRKDNILEMRFDER